MDGQTRYELKKRGIDPSSGVAAERPYTSYRAGDIETLFAEDSKYRDELRPGQVAWLRRVIEQRDGFIMRRHAGLPNAAEPWVQIRPHRYGEDDQGVLVQRWSHRHPWAFIHEHVRSHLPRGLTRTEFEDFEGPIVTGAGGGDFRIMPNTRGEGIRRKRMNSLRWLNAHERDHPRGPDDVPAEVKPDLAMGGGRMHSHWWDWTAHLTTGEYADQHARELKPNTFHIHDDYARYLYAPAAPGKPESGKERSAGIDVHPLAEEMLDRGGKRVYYAIEGVLKNDALLATGVPVFDTGSVTLWLPDELREFARTRLTRFDQVVVVPDSDWHSNPLVSRQANRIADLLRLEGLDVEIAAPPAKCGAVCRHKDRATRKKHKMGADDFVGPEQGGTVRQFIRIEVDRDKAPGAVASKRRVALLLEHAYSHCDIHGKVYQSIDEMADAIGAHRDTVMAAIADAEAENLVRYDVPDPEPGKRTPVGTLTLRDDIRPDMDFVALGA